MSRADVPLWKSQGLADASSFQGISLADWEVPVPAACSHFSEQGKPEQAHAPFSHRTSWVLLGSFRNWEDEGRLCDSVVTCMFCMKETVWVH